MVKWLTTIFIAIMATSYGWRISFDYDPTNDHVQMDTVCKDDGRIVFQAVDSFPIEPGSTSMSVRRHPTPAKAFCTITVFLFRNGSDSPVEDADILE